MSQQLTQRQAEIYRFLASKAAYRSNATIREVCERFGIQSPNGAKCLIDAIAAKGFIERDANDRKGGIRILKSLDGEPLT